MTNILDGNASHSLSSVVAFRGRDLTVPKGIDGGEMLAWASPEELLAYHLELAGNTKSFWKDGFFLYALWSMGDFSGKVPPAALAFIWAGWHLHVGRADTCGNFFYKTKKRHRLTISIPNHWKD